MSGRGSDRGRGVKQRDGERVGESEGERKRVGE